MSVAVLKTSDRPAFEPSTASNGDPAGRAAAMAFDGSTTGRLKAGAWDVDVGTFADPMNVDELVVVLEGRLRVEPAGAEPLELGAGDAIVVAKGTYCRWTVLEPVRARYAYVDG